MSESFWWHLLAGFLIGFAVSTLWEWLYFRRRRMTIHNRRIDELEATLRTYAAANGGTRADAVAADDWGEPPFDNPHVYLETEEPAPPADPSTAASAPQAAGFVAAQANTAAHSSTSTAPSSKPHFSAQKANFQSVAVQQPATIQDDALTPQPTKNTAPVAAQAKPVYEDAAPDTTASHQNDGNAAQRPTLAEATAVATVAAVIHNFAEDAAQPVDERVAPSDPASTDATEANNQVANNPAPESLVHENRGTQRPAIEEAAAAPNHQHPASSPTTSTAPPNAAPVRPTAPNKGGTPYYANGRSNPPDHGETRQPEQALTSETSFDNTRSNAPAATVLAASQTNKSITSSDLDALAASINNLIETVNPPPATTPTATAIQPAPQENSPYTTKITGKTEFVLVRLVQTVVQFFRQVRSILAGDGADKPTLYVSDPPVAGSAAGRDDLTKIVGLTEAHAERLRVGGITSFTQVAALSTDELRLMTFTPGAAPADYARWQAEAADLAAAGQGTGVR